jgi:transposase-like protein
MDPASTFCPHLACPARGQTGQGNIGIHSRKEQRFLCTECRKTFTATKGTAWYRLRTSAETVSLVGKPGQHILDACAEVADRVVVYPVIPSTPS